MTQILRNPFKQAVREEGTRPGPIYRPDADILERAEEYVVLVDLPGADEQSVQVRFEKDVLRIEASAAGAPDPAPAEGRQPPAPDHPGRGRLSPAPRENRRSSP